ncbi:hypothetical protein EG329_001547 [Mollisiaceae sp. DMI_Dod_QoI]|nr:hypothetical protein EG329_001547 [Helotiales sp. DMI_Dod_QoI]
MAPLTTFTCFKELPCEIQLLVWDHVETPYQRSASPQVHSIREFPRLKVKAMHPKVDVLGTHINYIECHRLSFGGPSTTSIGSRSDANAPIELHVGNGIFLSTTAPPIHPLLHICRQSRYYTLMKHNLIYKLHTYVNLEHDIFFLDFSRYMNRKDRGFESIWAFIQDHELTSQVNKIALPVRKSSCTRKRVEFLKPLLPSLKEVHFMYAHHYWNPTTKNNNFVDQRCTGRKINLLSCRRPLTYIKPGKMQAFQDNWIEGLSPPRVGGVPVTPTFHHHLLGFVDKEDEYFLNLEEAHRDAFDYLPNHVSASIF